MTKIGCLFLTAYFLVPAAYGQSVIAGARTVHVFPQAADGTYPDGSFYGSMTQRQSQQTVQTADRYELRLNQYCAQREALKNRESRSDKTPLLRSEALWGWQINSCVEVEVTGGEEWSYDLRDLTNGFFRPPKWVKYQLPLDVYDYTSQARAEGYWEAIEHGTDKELVSGVAVKIECDRSDSLCRELQASNLLGILKPDSVEYAISSWTKNGIVADTADDTECGVAHRLSIDFASNSVTVTDYPKKLGGKNLAGVGCQAFQKAASYALRGGEIMLSGQNMIFSCTKDGANNAILAKVREFHGDVGDKSYSLWMDDGNGGPPATVKTPEHPYTRDQCERLMEKKITELKAW